MKPSDLLESEDLNRLQIFIYLIPVLGFFPALWTLYRQAGESNRSCGFFGAIAAECQSVGCNAGDGMDYRLRTVGGWGAGCGFADFAAVNYV